MRVTCAAGAGLVRRKKRATPIPTNTNATKATAEKGEQLLDHGARAFCELLDDVDKFDPELFLRKP